jgi:hypothetical protein
VAVFFVGLTFNKVIPMKTPSASPAQAGQRQSASPFEELQRFDSQQWVAVASRAKDPVVARLIVDVLGAHPDLRTKRLGVYLVAREAVQRDRIRYARAHKHGQRVGAALSWLGKATQLAADGLIGIVRSAAAKHRAPAGHAALDPTFSREPDLMTKQAANQADFAESLPVPEVVELFGERHVAFAAGALRAG